MWGQIELQWPLFTPGSHRHTQAACNCWLSTACDDDNASSGGDHWPVWWPGAVTPPPSRHPPVAACCSVLTITAISPGYLLIIILCFYIKHQVNLVSKNVSSCYFLIIKTCFRAFLESLYADIIYLLEARVSYPDDCGAEHPASISRLHWTPAMYPRISRWIWAQLSEFCECNSALIQTTLTPRSRWRQVASVAVIWSGHCSAIPHLTGLVCQCRGGHNVFNHNLYSSLTHWPK